MNTTRIKAHAWEIKIAKLYLFFLPFRMVTPFLFLKDIIGPLAISFDLIFHVWGLFLWFTNNKGISIGASNLSLFNTVKNSILYLNLSSLIMAFVMYSIYGDHNGESPFSAILPMILFYFQYLFIFLYNIRVFSIVRYRDMISIFDKLCIVLLSIAFVQVAVMNGIGGAIYDVFASIVGGFNKSADLPKLCLTMSEGAGAGCVMGVFIFPYLLSRVLNGSRSAGRQLLLWLIPLYYTHSSTAMILFAVGVLFTVYRILFINNSIEGRKFIWNFFGYAILAVIALSVLSASGIIKSDVFDSINYLLFQKATDGSNGSAVSRTVTLAYNWGCFTEMPIMGVGNGLQGYFFNKYFPISAFYVEGSDVGAFYEIAQTGIANGDSFLPGYFSGYGIIGLVVLFNLVSRLRSQYRSRRYNLGIFGDMFLIGSICFIPMAIQGEAYSLYFAWFVLSIPFMFFSQDEINEFHNKTK